MRSPRLRLLAPPLAALVLVGCGPRGPSIPTIPRPASGDRAVSTDSSKVAAQEKGKEPASRQKRLPQLAPMAWPKQ